MENSDTGFLLDKQNIELYRDTFKDMLDALGINVLYRAPVESSKTYNLYGELDSNFCEPILVKCIYDEHPTQKTMRKLGWNSELSDTNVVIHVPYDTPGLQAGGLFIIPSGLDNTEGRVFKILRMTNIAVYPINITCELGPVFINNDDRAMTEDFSSSNFNVLDDESEFYNH